MIFIDSEKHQTQLTMRFFFFKKKSSYPVVSEACIAWFQSYLSEIIFFISVENQLSDCRRIMCGLLKGSILGPLLPLIYLNDMLQAVNSNLFLYADNSCFIKDIKQ